MTSQSPNTPDRIPNLGGSFHGAVDLGNIGKNDRQYDREEREKIVDDKEKLLKIARKDVIKNYHLPVAPRILLSGDKTSPEADENTAEVEETYNESIVELYVAKLDQDSTVLDHEINDKDRLDVVDNDSLVSFLAEERGTLMDTWHKSKDIKKEDLAHARSRRISHLAHITTNIVTGAGAGIIAHSTGSVNVPIAVSVAAAAGSAGFVTKTFKMSAEEHKKKTDLGDAGVDSPRNANSKTKLLDYKGIKKRVRNVSSEEERSRSIHDDITETLESLGFTDNKPLSLTEMRDSSTEFYEEIEANKSLKADYRSKFLAIVKAQEKSLKGAESLNPDALIQKLRRTHVETAIKIYNLELEMHDSKKIDKTVRNTRTKSALASVALITSALLIGQAKHTDRVPTDDQPPAPTSIKGGENGNGPDVDKDEKKQYTDDFFKEGRE
jgi:hypothetical protein